MQAVGGSEEGEGRTRREGKTGGSAGCWFSAAHYTQVPKNQGLGRVWKNILHSFLPFAFTENERGGEVHVVCIRLERSFTGFFIEPV